MSYAVAVDNSLIQQWLNSGLKYAEVEQELSLKGYESETIQAYLKAFKCAQCSKRQMQGFIWMGLGAFLGFLSCLLTVLNPFPALHSAILYGVTSVGVAMIFWGFYLVFEEA